MKNRRVFLLLIILLAFLLFSFKISPSFNFDSDFARDIGKMYDIAHGHFTLLGPKSSFGGLFTGPFYYYLFTPALIAGWFNIDLLLLFNAALFSLSIGYFYQTLQKKSGELKAFLATLSLSLLPIILFSARNPGNAYSYIPLLIFFITFVAFESIESSIRQLILGICAGLLVSTHYSNVVVVAVISIYIILLSKKKKYFLAYLAGFFATFSPLVLFELKNKLIMTRTTFINQSYKGFFKNKDAVSKLPSTFSSPLGRLFFINGDMGRFITMSPLLYSGFAVFSQIGVKLNKKLFILSLSALLGFISIAILFGFQYVSFYLISISLFVYISSIFLIVRSRYWLILVVFILIELSSFPAYLYTSSHRNIHSFKKAVDYILQKKLVDKNVSFNVIQIRPNIASTPYGDEYRYFFKKNGFEPKKENEYKDSNTLIIFSEVPNLNLASLSSWEAEQFGKEHFISSKEYRVGTLTIYKISK